MTTLEKDRSEIIINNAHSICSTLSLISSILSVIISIIMVKLILSFIATPRGHSEEGFIQVGIIFIGVVFLQLLSIILGVIGIISENAKRSYAIIGLTISSLGLIALSILIVTR